MSVYADARLTARPSGLASVLYAQVHESVGFGDERFWGSYANPDAMFFIFTPTIEAPNETYQLRAYRNFLSEEYNTPLTAGSVIKLTNPLGAVSVDKFQFNFT